MKKFICRTLLICSPLIALYVYPMIRFANGESFGDLSQLGNYFFNKEYIDQSSSAMSFCLRISPRKCVIPTCW